MALSLLVLILATTPIPVAKGESAILGDWTAIATNGFKAKVLMRFSPDHRFKQTVTEHTGRGKAKVHKNWGRWRLGHMDSSYEGQISLKEMVILEFEGKYPGRSGLFFSRRIPVLMDLTTAYARAGDEARVCELVFKQPYRPTWK